MIDPVFSEVQQFIFGLPGSKKPIKKYKGHFRKFSVDWLHYNLVLQLRYRFVLCCFGNYKSLYDKKEVSTCADILVIIYNSILHYLFFNFRVEIIKIAISSVDMPFFLISSFILLGYSNSIYSKCFTLFTDNS